MSIETTTVQLSLSDKEVPLGVSLITPDLVTCSQGLIEGIDFVVNRSLGTITRQRDVGSQVYSFTFKYMYLSDHTLAEDIFLAAQRADINNRFLNHALNGKTPSEIYTMMQTAIDGWTNLTQAKTALRDWLPLIAAVLAWDVLQNKRSS